MSDHVIPEITDPLGRSWRQPRREDILVDDTHALMSEKTFLQLAEYSASQPTGVYEGKMWRRHDGIYDQKFIDAGGEPVWLLCWFGLSQIGSGYCSNHYRIILIA